jgi:hypothetical protein
MENQGSPSTVTYDGFVFHLLLEQGTPKNKPKTKKPTLSRTFNPTLLTNILIMLFIKKKLKTYKNDIVLKLFYTKIFFK